jgi:hypothetical protein
VRDRQYNCAVVDEPEEEMGDDNLKSIENICQFCTGTGEGRNEYSYCSHCHGSGVNPKVDDDDWSYLYD